MKLWMRLAVELQSNHTLLNGLSKAQHPIHFHTLSSIENV